MGDQRTDRKSGVSFVPTTANTASFVRLVRAIAIGFAIWGAYLFVTNHPKGRVMFALGLVVTALGEVVAWRMRVIVRKYQSQKN